MPSNDGEVLHAWSKHNMMYFSLVNNQIFQKCRAGIISPLMNRKFDNWLIVSVLFKQKLQPFTAHYSSLRAKVSSRFFATSQTRLNQSTVKTPPNWNLNLWLFWGCSCVLISMKSTTHRLSRQIDLCGAHVESSWHHHTRVTHNPLCLCS